MRVLLARHGQTDWNAAGRIQGASDVPLNENGREQARKLASKLAASGGRLGAIYSSPLKRALETAGIIGRELDVYKRQRCAGVHCFCQDHINNHVHFTE